MLANHKNHLYIIGYAKSQRDFDFFFTQEGKVILICDDEPTSYEEDMSGLKSEGYLEAMKYKMDSMYTNKV